MSNIVGGGVGEGGEQVYPDEFTCDCLLCVKKHLKCKFVPRLLSMIGGCCGLDYG